MKMRNFRSRGHQSALISLEADVAQVAGSSLRHLNEYLIIWQSMEFLAKMNFRKQFAPPIVRDYFGVVADVSPR